MSTALITPSILIWARERAYFTLEKLAESLKITSDKVKLWEKGELKPTFKQAQTIAKLFQIPFGYLFLKEPPKDSLPIPDLRTFNNEPINGLSPEFKMTLMNIMLKQKWYKDYILENEGDEKYFLQQYTIKNTKESIIYNINQTLHLEKYIGQSLQKRIFLNEIIAEIEKLDILVMKNGIVGSNTRKSLKVTEFRGFAIYDRFAPLIFLNSKDTLSAQIFTLIHELVHLWIGESGVSLIDFQYTDNNIELFCNEITANILVPNTLLNQYWDNSLDLERHYTDMAIIFSVSTLVILNKLYGLKHISYKDYIYYKKIEQNKFLESAKNKPKNSGGNFYRTLKTRNGTNFSNALMASTLEGKTLYKDAASLLNTNFSNIKKFAKELGIM